MPFVSPEASSYQAQKKILLVLQNEMATRNLRVKRTAAETADDIVCHMAGIARSRLPNIERAYRTAAVEELRCMKGSNAQILRTGKHLAKIASEAGLSLTGVRP